MTTHRPRSKLLATLLALAWAGGCSDHPCATCPPPPPSGLLVSDPVSTPALSAATRSTLAGSGAGEAVFVSLAPGTVPTGSRAFVSQVGDADSLITTVTDGGFDPIALSAQLGDSIDVAIKDASGTIVYHTGAVVAATRRPVIVRTQPPPRKRDVPLNAAMVVVFSEPVASGGLSSSVHLFRGNSAVPGTVELLQGTGAVVAFVPSAALAPNADYRLEIAGSVQDLDGEALSSGVTVAFTTGRSSTGPAASITVSPDSVFIPESETTYQMTATVRDAAGNQLVDQPVTWATSNSAGLAVTQTGLLTPLAAGSYFVTATVNGVSGEAFIYVRGGPPASMTLSPTPATVGAAGDTIILTATVRDAANRVIYPSVAWTSSDPAVATVAGAYLDGSAYGTVTGMGLGSVVVTATSGTASATASITVSSPPPPASLTISPGSATLLLRATSRLSVTLRDANGRVLTGRRSLAWGTSEAAVATVDTAGLVAAVGVGSAFVSAASEGASDTAVIAVTTLPPFRSVTAANEVTCALTTSGAAYCWGTRGGGLLFVDSNATVPVAISGGLTFSSLSAGVFHTCGVATNGAAYCWGSGPIGNGSTTGSATPVPAAGGLTFSAVSVNTGVGTDFNTNTCGLTASGTAYCWGVNYFGQLGIGYAVGPEDCDGWACSTTPLAVIGGHTFSRLGAGGYHSCGLAANGSAYCWAQNFFGQLGIGSTSGPEECRAGVACSTRPVLVAGGLTFSELAVGYHHTCTLTAAGTAYCWGENLDGELGNGSTANSAAPVPVGGGLTFSALSAGMGQTCGLTTAGTAYCWGGSYGSLPAAVPGGLTFSVLSTGGGHACGITVDGTLYCWGSNGSGQLGNSTTTDSSVPVKVAGQP